MSLTARERASWKTTLGRLRDYDPVPLDLAVSTDPHPSVASGLRFAIATPSFNQADYLDRTIESVLGQNYPTLQYWVQDGASTDHTSEVLERWREQGLDYESAPDEGQADAINRGFGRVEGDVMAWLNSDDLLLPGSLRAVAQTFSQRPDVDVVYGHRILIDTEGRDVGRWIMPHHENGILTWADYIPQETMFWRRSLWDQVGGSLDTSFNFALDWDLILRFRDIGANFYRIPRFLGAFRVHEEQKTSAEMASLGAQEMAKLRSRAAGRPIEQAEASERTKLYLAKASIYSSLWKLGLANYGPH